MAESPAHRDAEVPEEVEGQELAEEPEPEGPDLSSLNDAGRSLLYSALEVLAPYDPQPGTLGDIPQLTLDRQHILDACRAAKSDERIGTKMLLCLAAVDYPPSFGAPSHGRRQAAQAAEETKEAEEEPEPVGKMQVVYFLQSLEPERTLALKTDAPYDDPVVPSVTSVWRAADWYEREAHDLFGLSFEGHPDPAPLLLYDEFRGIPRPQGFSIFRVP